MRRCWWRSRRKRSWRFRGMANGRPPGLPTGTGERPTGWAEREIRRMRGQPNEGKLPDSQEGWHFRAEVFGLRHVHIAGGRAAGVGGTAPSTDRDVATRRLRRRSETAHGGANLFAAKPGRDDSARHHLDSGRETADLPR